MGPLNPDPVWGLNPVYWGFIAGIALGAIIAALIWIFVGKD